MLMPNKDKKEKINWFWAHRRNASMHHISFFGESLCGHGFLPVCDFYFDHQLYLGVPGNGCYIFYDRHQLSQADCYGRIQKSIDKNYNFIKEYRRKSERLFGALLLQSSNIDKLNLSLLKNWEIADLYKSFISAITAGPIITVQLWGIEALIQPKYKIISLLSNRLKQQRNENKFQTYCEILLTNIGETVAYSEQKDFFRVASTIYRNKNLLSIFEKKSLSAIGKQLARFPRDGKLIDSHIAKYAWINSEYTSGIWPKSKWLALFKKALVDPVSPSRKLKNMKRDFLNAKSKRYRLVKKLKPSKDVMHAMDCLTELIAQRDWSKGYYVKALLSYRKLLFEIAKRIDETKTSILYYHFLELKECLARNKALSKKEINLRKKFGFIIINKTKDRRVISGLNNIKKTLRKEGIANPTEAVKKKISIIKGIAANKGKVIGRARVIDKVGGLAKFKQGEILVTYMTTMEFTPLFRKAAAVVTDEGGMSSHAAIISCEFDIPCIVGTKVATRVIKTGDKIEVNAFLGNIVNSRI